MKHLVRNVQNYSAKTLAELVIMKSLMMEDNEQLRVLLGRVHMIQNEINDEDI